MPRSRCTTAGQSPTHPKRKKAKRQHPVRRSQTKGWSSTALHSIRTRSLARPRYIGWPRCECPSSRCSSSPWLLGWFPLPSSGADSPDDAFGKPWARAHSRQHWGSNSEWQARTCRSPTGQVSRNCQYHQTPMQKGTRCTPIDSRATRGFLESSSVGSLVFAVRWRWRWRWCWRWGQSFETCHSETHSGTTWSKYGARAGVRHTRRHQEWRCTTVEAICVEKVRAANKEWPVRQTAAH